MSDLRRYLRPEFVLLGLVLILAVVGVVLYLKLGTAQDEVKQLEEQITATNAVLRGLEQNEAELRAELGRLEAPPETPSQLFPSRAEALNLSTAFAGYAAERALLLGPFDSVQTRAQLNEVERPAISYTMVAQGSAGSLLEMLALLRDVPTGVVQVLDMTRDAQIPDRWLMNLQLLVFYEGS